ncbi:hypothetical protein UY3_03479 [Chelonia mydas]|uniref:Uncharacterized protein n=1 Tax=Chelonia mydas TaxID=8469 RepID=M7BN61_CHEMY|nr:hypothetical protein UY3_03479 [Chelonia mydas]
MNRLFPPALPPDPSAFHWRETETAAGSPTTHHHITAASTPPAVQPPPQGPQPTDHHHAQTTAVHCLLQPPSLTPPRCNAPGPSAPGHRNGRSHCGPPQPLPTTQLGSPLAHAT